MRDTNLCLKTSAAVTQNTNGTEVDFGAGDVRPLTYTLNVTAASGTSPTLDVKIQESATSGSGHYDALNFQQISAAGVYRVTGRLDRRYRRAVFTVGGTSPSFTCELYPEMGGEYTKF